MRIANHRSGLSLMEVLISLLIFITSFAVIGQLVSIASDYALVAQFKQEGVFLCESKLAELAAGAEPFDSMNAMPFEHDPEWVWTAHSEMVQTTTPRLWQVEVIVQRERAFGAPVTVTMSKMIIDPWDRGSTLDPPPPTVEEEMEEPEEEESSGTGGN